MAQVLTPSLCHASAIAAGSTAAQSPFFTSSFVVLPDSSANITEEGSMPALRKALAQSSCMAEKRGGMKLGIFDAYINVIGGLHLDEPGADLPVVLAIASSYREQAIADDLVAIGEIGLTGEIRAVSNLTQRLAEVARLGFHKCIIPYKVPNKLEIPEGLTVYRVKNLREAIEIAM